MSTFTDLPEELQIEIFSILSVKHLEKILSINKTTHNHIIHSETFWKQLVLNYSKGISTNPQTLIPNDQPFKVSDYQSTLRDLTRLKKYQTQDLIEETNQLQEMTFELSMVEKELTEKMNRDEISSSSSLRNNIEMEMQHIKMDLDSVRKLMEETNEKLKLLKID